MDWIGTPLRYPTKKVNTIVSVQATIEINGDISLSSLSRKLDHTNINKQILEAALNKHQEELTDRLCGERYSRVENRPFKRAGTTRRTLVTRHGNLTLRVIKVRSAETGGIFTPLLLDLGVEPRRRIVDDLVLESAEAATLLTYRDTVKVIESLTEAQTSRHRVHRYVQKVGSYVGEGRRKAVPAKVDVMYGDGTKTHGLGGGKNEVNVVLGRDGDTGCKHLLSLEVNKAWPMVAEGLTTKASLLVSDADRPMRNALRCKADSYQLCVNHAVKEAGNHLWRAGLPKAERRLILGRLRLILRILRSSVKKHLVDKDYGRLRWRISWTLDELAGLADELAAQGLVYTAGFIRRSANYVVTYARLALRDLRVPYTNNLIERLMGEVAKRVKNRWMHWSTAGLENLLNILLVRYCDGNLYSSLMGNFYKDEEPVIFVRVA